MNRLAACALALAAASCLPAGRAFAAFEDADISPRTAAMGGAFTAVAEGTDGLPFNPAGLAAQREPELGLGFARLRVLPAGASDRSDISVALAGRAPFEAEGGWGGLWRRGVTEGFAADKEFTLGYAWRGVWESEQGRLDFGVDASALNRSSLNTGDGATTGSLGLGALLYLGSRYRFGASLLNVNQPALNVDGVSDQAPRAFKLGFARTLPFWSVAFDFTQRASSLAGDGGFSLGAGVEHWWTRADLGAAALRSGLNLGSQGETYSAGFGLQRGGAELSYAIQLPLGDGKISHLLAFHFYFGGREPQDVYQQLLRQEIEAREDLRRLIERQEDLLAKLRQDLLNSRIEVEKLRLELEGKPAQKEKSDEKLKWLLELQDQLRSDLHKADNQRRELVRRREAPSGYPADWAAYGKLKASGAPANVLAESLQGLIDKYRGTGTDLSEAYSEYLKVQGAP